MKVLRRKFLTVSGCSLAATIGAPLASAQSNSAKSQFDKEADVIVIGMGGAGMTTAISAADAGANVIVLERQPKATLRSNTRMAGGMLHNPSKNGNKQALKEYAKAMFSGENLPFKIEGEQPETSDALAEVWAEYSPYVLDFLQAQDPLFKGLEPPRIPGRSVSGGASFPDFPGAKESGYAEVRSSYTDRINFGRPHYGLPKEQTSNGEALHNCLMTGVEKRADKIQVDYETRAQKLIQNEKGEVIGVTAINKDGNPVTYMARKGVVLCCGGYEYSKTMRRAFLEGPSIEGWAFYGSPFNEGDGIRMGLDVGAGMQKVASCASRLVYPSPVRHNGMRMAIFAPVVLKYCRS